MIRSLRSIGAVPVPLMAVLFGVVQDARASGHPPHAAITIARDADFRGRGCATLTT